MDSVENQLSRLVEERRSVDMETQNLHSQLAKAQDRVRAYCNHRIIFMFMMFRVIFSVQQLLEKTSSVLWFLV